jgi:hypothetical protein
MPETFDDLPEQLRQLKGQPEGLSTPDGYFDQFNDRLIERLRDEGDLKAAVPSLKKTWVNVGRISAAAAAVAALLVAGWWWYRPETPATTPDNSVAVIEAAELTPEIAAAYISDNIDDFEEELLAAINVEEQVPASTKKNMDTKKTLPKKAVDNEELDQILDDLTEEELEEIL